MRFPGAVSMVVFAGFSACAEPNDEPSDVGDAADLSIGGEGGATFELPLGFTPTDLGAFRLGEELSSSQGGAGLGGAAPEERECDGIVLAVVRDFRRGDAGFDGHPDFQTFVGDTPSLGMVEPLLGAQQKPLPTAEGPFIDPVNGQQTTGPERFAEWYQNVPGVNRAYLLELAFAPHDGHFSFYSRDFFPLDGFGYGQEELPHNYHFTTELHLRFRYREGDHFTFVGDDDLWVFIDGQLAIDLGGLHAEAESTVALDEHAGRLGLEVGQIYALDLFHAERAVVYSNFRVDTNLELTGCGDIVR